MLDRELRLVIPGHPKPKGSLKCIGGRGGRGHVLIEDNKGTAAWRGSVAGHVRRLITTPAGTSQPVGVELTMTVDRPKSHYGTGRNAQTLKATAPARPTGHGTGDVDKHARCLLDALQDAGAFPDDCAVVELTARKAYLDPDPLPGSDVLGHPGVVIRLYPLT